jgi:3-hydroxyisobutyrate dehydrogenase-like beta-hydroxyacid dehydrogenase
MRIGFIGTGQMGSRMARNLAASGHTVAVYNRTKEKAEALCADGARVAESPGHSCEGAEVVFTMLADDAATEEVVFGAHGIAEALPKGSIHVACSTISTAIVKRLAAEHARRSQGYVSAPVFGLPPAAADRKLLIMAAGPVDQIERCQPLFDAMGRKTFVIGTDPWQANLVKLCGNFTILGMVETLGEATAMLRKSNVAPGQYLDVMNELFASPLYKNYGNKIVSDQFEPAAFPLHLGLKDARLILKAADESMTPMPLAGMIHAHMLAALIAGQGELDWSSLARVASRNAGV